MIKIFEFAIAINHKGNQMVQEGVVIADSYAQAAQRLVDKFAGAEVMEMDLQRAASDSALFVFGNGGLTAHKCACETTHADGHVCECHCHEDKASIEKNIEKNMNMDKAPHAVPDQYSVDQMANTLTGILNEILRG